MSAVGELDVPGGSSCRPTTWPTRATSLLDHYDDEPPINVGIGEEVSIAELAESVAKVVGYLGEDPLGHLANRKARPANCSM